MGSVITELHSGENASHDATADLVEKMLEILRCRREFDFAGYRRATIERRILNRIAATRSGSLAAYLELLSTSESEIDRLAANLTIKVSRFYRDASVFDALRDRILPELRQRAGGRALRVWSAGCARGEEAWTLAMLLRDGDRVVATDIDEAALDAARRGAYPEAAFEETPEDLLRSGTVETARGNGRSVSDALRRRVTFIRHALGADPAPPEGAPFDLVCCRNVIIYFAQPLQRRSLEVLVGNLLPEGVLCLGEAEWVGQAAGRLEVLDRRLKLFSRRPTEDRRS